MKSCQRRLRGNKLSFYKYLLIVLIVVLAGCSKTKPGKMEIARLDNQTLALEDIRAHIDSTRELSQAQVQQYIQRWLTEESLYREAVERGLDRTDEMNQRVEKVRRQLAINALLEKEVYPPRTSESSSQEIHQYYDAHIKEFNLLHDVALVSYALFKNRDAATECRNLVLKGTQWRSVINQHASAIVARVDSVYQTQATLLPTELWRVASNTTNRDPSFPISTTRGYYVLVVWKFAKQGQTSELPLVEQEISGRLTIERRRKLFDQLVQSLRAKHSIEVFVGSIADTVKQKEE